GALNHSYDDNGLYTVTVKVTDNDGAGLYGQASFQVGVANVAPVATFSAPASVPEGSTIDLALANPGDPSNADTAAGFTYAFDCDSGSGYGVFGASNIATCPTSDNGSRTVKGRIRDKDYGTREYTAGVTITNVSPT